ncbi:MAG: motility protein A, partial [Lachnospiraceae bacterium]|nr:motility protein A [Lachnospiraceae bacterium]
MSFVDLASLIGLVVCIVLVLWAVIQGAGSLGAAYKAFIDLQSVLITIGGSFLSVMAMNTMKDYVNG